MATVLVVDDSMIMRKKIIKILAEMGHICVAEAGDGYHACVAYKKFTPEFVTMDITMPGMDGIEAVRRIKADFSDAVIVMVTSHGQENMVIKSIQNGASGYILKPIQKDKIQIALDSCNIKGQDMSKKKDIPEDHKDAIKDVTEEEKDKDNDGETVNLDDIKETVADTDKKKKVANIKKPKDSLTLFNIENRSGIFVVLIETKYHTLDFDMISDIRDTISGLLVVKPLNFIFNLDDIELFDSTKVYEEFFELIKDIKDVNGLIRIFLTNQDIIDILIGSDVKSSIKILDNLPD